MQKLELNIPGVFLLTPKIFRDERGYFTESYNKQTFEQLGICSEFVQDNVSFNNKKGTLRGLHTQKGKYAQSKLIECIEGSIYDIVVDIREGSPTYMKWLKIFLSNEKKEQLFIPTGLLHGYITLEENCKILYKVDQYYSSENEQSIAYNDPSFNIDWGIETPILSLKDQSAPFFKEVDIKYFYGE